MHNLSTTSSIIKVTTASAGSISATYSYADISSSTFAPSGIGGLATATITSATTTTIVSAPSSGNIRNVRHLKITNTSSSISNLVTITHDDGSNTNTEWRGTLLPYEAVEYDETGLWTVYGTDGLAKASTIANIQQLPATTTVVPTSDTDTIKIFARKQAGKMSLKYITPIGAEYYLQERLSEGNYSLYLPNNGTTIGLNFGANLTSGGTVSHPTQAISSLFNSIRKTRWSNIVTATNQILGLRTLAVDKRYWRGNAAGLGGFNFHARFSIGIYPASTVRLFVGLTDSVSGVVSSDTLVGNSCGLWHDTTDASTVLSFVTRNNVTTTKAGITLGNPLAAGQIYDFWMWCAPNDSIIYYALKDLTTGNILADTSTITTLPLNTTFLGPELAMSNGTANVTVASTGFELASFSCNSDY